MKRVLVALAASAFVAAPVRAASVPTLHRGSHGQRVAGLQWMLAGHRPNVFTQVKETFVGNPNGLFGEKTAAAVVAYKYRLGYPRRLVKPIAGPYLFALLRGKAKRPARWVALAADRVKAVEAAKPSRLAAAISSYETSQLGVSEHPPGCNCGQQVSMYQADTGAFRAAWCVSFQQHSFRIGGYGHFANDTASVYYAVDYYAARNMLHAKPKVGALVFFVDYNRYGQRIPGTGHAGYVVKVGAGWYVSIEGNKANAVREIFHHLGDRGNVFAYLPGVA